MKPDQLQNIAAAFSKQAPHFDEEEKSNAILQHLRSQVRSHVLKFLKKEDSMLELNCGTGLDAIFFSGHCKEILATDISEGMISELNSKLSVNQAKNISTALLSFTELDKLKGKKFNYVFSNFGGLNCLDDLAPVTSGLKPLLHTGAHITLVIMPPFCLMETLSLFKGNFKLAFRRWKKGGALSQLEGESFQTYYFTPRQVIQSFGKEFIPIYIEGLGVSLPQPHQKKFPQQHYRLFSFLKRIDALLRKFFPFNRWGDHFIITMKYLPG